MFPLGLLLQALHLHLIRELPLTLVRVTQLVRDVVLDVLVALVEDHLQLRQLLRQQKISALNLPGKQWILMKTQCSIREMLCPMLIRFPLH